MGLRIINKCVTMRSKVCCTGGGCIHHFGYSPVEQAGALPSPAGTSEPSESYPGLWEIPLWAVHTAEGALVSAMDPEGDVFELYKQELDWRLAGNKAPLGLFLHAGGRQQRALGQ